MNTPVTPGDTDLRRRARRRVAMRNSLGIHALVFVLVNLGLWTINAFGGGPRWHFWPLFGWGLGLAIHGIVTLLALHGEGWRERQLEREVERLRQPR